MDHTDRIFRRHQYDRPVLNQQIYFDEIDIATPTCYHVD